MPYILGIDSNAPCTPETFPVSSRSWFFYKTEADPQDTMDPESIAFRNHLYTVAKDSLRNQVTLRARG